MLHAKVRWALIASIISTAAQAVVSAGGVSLPAWAASACTALVALLAGYHAPDHAAPQDPEAPGVA